MSTEMAVAMRPSALAATIALAFIPALAFAADEAPLPEEKARNTTTLESVEVRADQVERREQSLRRAQHSGTSVTIGRERIEQSNVIGSEDLLRYAPNITLRSRYIGDRNALIGGRSNSTVQGSRSLVYIDGLLISDLLGANFNPPRWGMVSPAEIKDLDVLYGPFSAELPGNSMGTTLQITTRYPRALTATGDAQFFSQSFSDDYGFDGRYNGNRVNATLGQSLERWRWFVAAGRLDTTSHPMQYATQSSFITSGVSSLPLLLGAIGDVDPTGKPRVILGPTGIEDTRQVNAKFKAGFDITDQATLEFVLGYWQNDYQRHAVSFLHDANGAPVFAGNWRLPDGRGIRISESALSPQDGAEEHWQSALSLTWKLSDNWALQAIASDYSIVENRLSSASTRPPAADLGGAGLVSFGDGTGWNTFDIKLDGSLGAHRFRTGLHGDYYVLEQRVFATGDWRSETLGSRTSLFGGKARTAAAYVQDTWQFAPAWELGAGVRFEQWKAFDGVRAVGTGNALPFPERKISAWSPKFSLSRELGQDWILRASMGKAVRFPTVSELFQGTISNNAIVNSDPNLRPERSYSKELALEGKLAGGDARVSLFEDDIRDSLFTQTNFSVTPTISNIQNIGHIRNRGLELSGTWQNVGIDGLSLTASTAFNRPRILDNDNFPGSVGKRAPRIPKTRASAVLSYTPDDVWRFSLAGRYSGRQFDTLDNTDIHPDVFGGVSSFTVFDAKVARKLRGALSLGLGVDNLTDQNVFVFHPWPRRTFFLELRYEENKQ